MDSINKLLDQDRQIIWHPYSAVNSDLPIFPVKSAQGVRIKLMDDRELIDGMSSWWSAIHGYNHPVMNRALNYQLESMAHVMFGGLTHQPAVDLACKLVEITPKSLQTVFFSDSGSVAVEVAMKMAIQYWYSRNKPNKQKMLSIRHGYHGDTFAAMSVSDPVNGMHSLFASSLAQQFFADAPDCKFHQDCTDHDLRSFLEQLEKYHHQIAAVILEPIVQGAGGMRFYSPTFLKRVRELCNQFNVLLILDEIATGFGRTGKLFACEHAKIEPDIMCLGKALTAGYMTLAATMTTTEIASSISNHEPGIFMHGPTFMANPLACTMGLASIDILLNSSWQNKIQQIENILKIRLKACLDFPQVKDVRVIGAIGVVELHHPVNLKTIQPQFVKEGVWLRPFNKLIYIMPPYIINKDELCYLINAIIKIISRMK